MTTSAAEPLHAQKKALRKIVHTLVGKLAALYGEKEPYSHIKEPHKHINQKLKAADGVTVAEATLDHLQRRVENLQQWIAEVNDVY